MKIALFIRSLAKGGAEKQSLLISNYLANSYETHLIVLHKGDAELLKTYNTIANIHYLSGNRVKSLINLYFILKKYRINTLINFLPSNNIIGLIIGRLARVNKIYAGVRGTKLKSPAIKRWVQKQLINRLSTGIISNSYAAKDSYSAYGYKKDKFSVIHNIFDIQDFTKKIVTSESITILSVGRFVSEKEYDVAIKAIHKLKDIYPNIHIKYQIVGYGLGRESIVGLIRQLKMENDVEIIDGQLNNPDKFYKNADIYLLTSKYEGMPNTVMEAMNYQLPIVTTNAGDAKYLVHDGVNGFVVEIGNVEQIYQKLALLIMDNEKRQNFGRNGKQILQEHFSAEKIITDLIEVINR